VGIYGAAPITGTAGVATGSGLTYGVYGSASSSSGIGVYGQSSGAAGSGIYGFSTGSGSGVTAASTNGYAIDANGGVGEVRLGGETGTIHANQYPTSTLELHANADLLVHLDDDDNSTSYFGIRNGANTTVFTVTETGAISWSARTGYLAVPAGAFRPERDGYSFLNTGAYLIHYSGPDTLYAAPVQLPHGVMVTKMTFHWKDNSTTYNATCTLYVHNLAITTQSAMATATSTGSAGNGSSYDDTIASAVVSNSAYTYYLVWDLPSSSLYGYGVVIEYTYTGPH
jgi:hypothetical protein